MIGDGVITKLTADRQRVGRKRGLQRQRAVEPSEKTTRFFRVEDCLFYFHELAAREFEKRPLATVGRYANEMLALLALPVGEIIRHSPLNIAPFFVEIMLCLKNRAPNQGINATLDFRNPLFKIKVA